MKSPRLKLLLALLVLVAPFLISKDAFAAGTVADSSASGSNGGFGFSFNAGITGYPDSHWIECYPSGNLMTDGSETSIGGCSTLLSTSTPYTILSYGAVSVSGSIAAGQLWCTNPGGSGVLYTLPGGEFFHLMADQYAFLPASDFISFASDVPIHCSTTLKTDNHLDYYFIQYVPYDTRVILNPMNINWTQPVIIAGFWTAILCWGVVIQLFKKKI